MKNGITIAVLSLAVVFFGCEKAQEKPAPKEDRTPASSPRPSAKPGVPAAPTGSNGHGGEVVPLGTTKVGAIEVRASRDKGDITPGGEAPIDVVIDGGVGKDVAAVRFWIGSEDAKGSMKAKAEIENAKWHTHVEVPAPMPEGSKLWVEIELADGKKSTTSFELLPGE